MAGSAHKMVYAACALAVVASVATYAATGAKPFSRHEDETITTMNEESGLGDLFADAGDTSGATEAAAVESGYMFGLLPGGPGLDSLSVASVSGAAIAVSGGMFLMGRRKNKRAHAHAAAGEPAAEAG